MRRIFYDTSSGKIVSCRNISDANLAKNLELAPGCAYINGTVPNNRDYKINLETLAIEQVAPTFDLTEWVRTRRTIKLNASDWTQGADSPLSDSKKAEWQTYRQTLRDFPANLNGSWTTRDDVVWPTEPE